MNDTDRAAATVKVTPNMTEIDYDSDLLQKQSFNFFDPSLRRQAFATPMICSALVGCAAGALWLRMKRRRAELIAIRGCAFPKHGESERGDRVLDSVVVELEVDCLPEHLDILEEEKRHIQDNGCPAIRYVQNPIHVDLRIDIK